MAPRHFRNDEKALKGEKNAGSGNRGRGTERPGTNEKPVKPSRLVAPSNHNAVSRQPDNRQQVSQIGLPRILLTLVIMVVLGVTMVNVVPRLMNSFSAGASEPGQEVKVFIPEGSSTRQISQALKDANVVGDMTAFINSCTQRGVTSDLKPGWYTLKTGMSISDVIDMMVAGPPDNSNRLTIPEGLTIEQTAIRVEQACGIPAQEFIAEAYNASKYQADYAFLSDCYNNSLEGYLYPKTYPIPPGANAEFVVRVLLGQFARETAGVDWQALSDQGISSYQVLICASLIERETYQPEERALVASVIYNRMHKGMRLQVDATVVYALNDPYRDYATQPLLYTDLETVSPYNTYQVDGLPAGPICSPQIASIRAAAEPGQTDYYYYVLTTQDGHHTFCQTEAQFDDAVKVYNQVFGKH